MPYTLVLLRHGQSTWNLENRFTGWVDVDLTDEGARRGAPRRAATSRTPASRPTSCTRRCSCARSTPPSSRCDECERSWIPVRRSWRLNERHYGALQGKDKAETARQFVAEQVKIWRRSYDVPPDPLADRRSQLRDRRALRRRSPATCSPAPSA